MRAAILAIGVLSAAPAAAADDEVIDEVVTTARYIASTIGKSPAPLIETPFTIDVIDREVIDLRNIRTSNVGSSRR
jgi:outer membrane receptor protein involved in Fe transport